MLRSPFHSSVTEYGLSICEVVYSILSSKKEREEEKEIEEEKQRRHGENTIKPGYSLSNMGCILCRVSESSNFTPKTSKQKLFSSTFIVLIFLRVRTGQSVNMKINITT